MKKCPASVDISFSRASKIGGAVPELQCPVRNRKKEKKKNERKMQKLKTNPTLIQP